MFSFKKNNLDKIKSFILNSEEIEIDKDDKEKLIKMIRPTIGIKTNSTDDENIKIGKSKIGGKPDLPKDFQWPRANGKPMLFCAQYNLSELTKFDQENVLPEKGFFHIFLSLDEKWKEFNGVNQDYKFIFSETEDVVRWELPNELEEIRHFKSSVIEYFEFYTLPHYENYKLFDFYKSYESFMDDIHEPINEYIKEICGLNEDTYHQILGEDRSMQSSVVYDFSAKELNLYGSESSEYQKNWDKILKLSKSYELLLQLDCYDSNSDLKKFGGEGKYYFGISKTDLEKKKFNDIKMSFQL
jgi:uncharacterized protein YwqG